MGIFWPPPPFETTKQRYQEIVDAGFTFAITGNYLFDQYILKYALTQADAVGLKMLIADDQSLLDLTHRFTISDDRTTPMSISSADAAALAKQIVATYQGHPSLAGFNLYDEPSGQAVFDSLGKAMGAMRTAAPGLLPYINLLPGQGPGQDTYLNAVVDAVHPPLLSFDRYPMSADGNEDPNYLTNWAQHRAVAQAAGIPSWVFIQTLAFNGRRSPSAADLAWQVNISLAYGAKGIQYFTYWTPDPARGEGFQSALLTVDGKRTEHYADSKHLNATWLSRVGKVLKHLPSESVEHANEPNPPARVAVFAPDDWVASVTGAAVVLGRFTDPANASVRYLLVANRTPHATSTVTLGLGPAAKGVAAYVARTDSFTPAKATARLPLTLAPGGATLLRLDG
ncbi:hypothetical protein BIV57_18575 [Mangrovactinospora gilvigrisea]|uniref:Glycoside hydrolase family 42 N-terminal domain-containing protein n=1 Tax=Mangrovactinospora gilvigrisea TaxID=1428644 RepID=A0A1J7C8Q5_9ACTN|nr:hypothetical protein BIV57_18575 [Mangrovactinospora gilvigrisea]